MPLTQTNITVNVNWAFQRLSPPFNNVLQGPDGRNFNLNGLDLTIFTEALVEQLVINPGTGVEIDLLVLQNLVEENFGFSQVMSMIFLPTGVNANCNVAPGTPNGFVGPFGSSANNFGINVPTSGIFLISTGADAPGGTEGGGDWVVDINHRHLLINNNGLGVLTVTLFLLGG